MDVDVLVPLLGMSTLTQDLEGGSTRLIPANSSKVAKWVHCTLLFIYPIKNYISYRIIYKIINIFVGGKSMTNNIRICKLCKTQMKFSTFYMCQDCLFELDRVSAYIKKHHYATLDEISQGTSLTPDCVERIIEFFRHSKTSIKQ